MLNRSNKSSMQIRGQRNSNLELVRILAMITIIFSHARKNVTEVTFCAKAYTNFSGIWGVIGMDLFVMISAYFLIEQEFKIKRILNLFVRTASYIVLMTALFLIWETHKIGSFSTAFIEVVQYHETALFDPLWTNQYWFVTAYICLLIISPLLNLMLKTLDSSKIRTILILFCFIPIFVNFSGYSCDTITDTLYFAYIYVLIGYFKISKYKASNPHRITQLAVVGAILNVVGRGIYMIETDNNGLLFVQKIVGYTITNMARHSLFMSVEALLLFYIILNQKPFTSKIINAISPYMLGVYLFHENPLFNICNLSVTKAIDIGFIKEGIMFIPTYTLVILIIFIAGIITDFVYAHMIHVHLMNFINKRFSKRIESLDNKINSI